VTRPESGLKQTNAKFILNYKKMRRRKFPTLYCVHPDYGALSEWLPIKRETFNKEVRMRYHSAALWIPGYDSEGNAIQTFVPANHEGRGYSLLSSDFIDEALEGRTRDRTKWFIDKDQAIEYSKGIFDRARPKGRVWKVVKYFDDVEPSVVRSGLTRKEAMDLYDSMKPRMYTSYTVQC